MSTKWVKIIWINIHGDRDSIVVERDGLTNWDWLQELDGSEFSIEGWCLFTHQGNRVEKSVRVSMEFVAQLEILDATDWEDFNGNE